jgi:hypothetical protein
MRILVIIALAIGLGVSLAMWGCSLFQPTPVAPVAPAGPTQQQIVQKVIACVTSSVMPCLTQPPPMNNPQMCMALAGAQCVAAN